MQDRMGRRHEVSRQTFLLSSWSAAAAMTVCCAAFAAPAELHTVDALFRKAQAFDARLRVAKHELMAAQARADQANAGRWPQVHVNGSTQDVDQQLSYEGGMFRNRADRFNANSYQLQLTQPVFRLADVAQRKEAQAQLARQRAEVEVEEMALLVRLSQAFFEACHFREVLVAASTELVRYQAESLTMQARVNRGDAAQFDALLPQAGLRQAEAKQHEAIAQIAQRLNVLSTLVGQVLESRSLDCDLVVLPEPEGSLESWVDLALEHSPQIQAGKMALVAAHAQMERAAAAHWFTLDIVASKSISRQGPTASVDVGNRTYSTAVGLEVSVPVFQGGFLTAKQREAAAQWNKAAAELDSVEAALRVELGASWAALTTALAYEEAISVRKQALVLNAEAYRKRWKRGVTKEVEMLVAQQELAQTNAELLRIRGEAWQALIKLYALSGRQEMFQFVRH